MILLFDLDGTLTDPREGIVGSARYAFERLGLEAPADDLLATFIGPPLRGMFSTLMPGSSRARVEEAVLMYRERYQDIGVYETVMYPGVPDMLARAKGLAGAVFLATSKPWIFAERVLAHLGIAEHFDGVYGPELDGSRDDKGVLIAHLLESEGAAAAGTVMVGDREADVVAATRNGVEPVGVLWGYGSREELEGAGARKLVRTTDELVVALGAIAQGVRR